MSIVKKYKVIGIMSGTSMDGLDCSYIETDGKNYTKIIFEKTYKYSNLYKNKLKKIINIYNYNNKIINILKYEDFITNKFIQIINQFILEYKIKKYKVNFIGVSGQTIYHSVKYKKSIQLGSCKKIQKNLNINIIGNFRDNDIKNGGQGAPIGAYYHKYLINKIAKNAAIINIGGVSNITYVKNKKLIAFDIGPGNSLIDDLMFNFYKKNFDKNGNNAYKGKKNNKLIQEFKKDEFFNLNYPKSLDRNYFKKYYNKLKKINKKDSICTATLMTVEGILLGIKLTNKRIKEIILTGGGRKNLFLFNNLKLKLLQNNIKLTNIDNYGFNGDTLEAQMFGYLAIRSYKKLPLSLNSTTGVKKPTTGGVLYSKIIKN